MKDVEIFCNLDNEDSHYSREPSEFEFEIIDGYAALVLCSSCSDCIKLPDSYLGYPVSEINDGAFFGCYNLKSLSLPKTIKKISSAAFMGCQGLEDIKFSGNVGEWYKIDKPDDWDSDIEWYTINCLNDRAEYCEYQTEHGKVVSTPLSHFEINMYKLRHRCYFFLDNYLGHNEDNIVLPDICQGTPITRISEQAFFNCKAKSIYIPDSYIFLGDYSFAKSDMLKSVRLSARIESIPDSCFEMTGLTDIDLPDGLKTISCYAFSGCHMLERITIPKCVKSIEYAAFSGSGLREITLYHIESGISECMLKDCKMLTSINFLGTKSQWDSMPKGASWDSGTGKYTIYFSDGTSQPKPKKYGTDIQ